MASKICTIRQIIIQIGELELLDIYRGKYSINTNKTVLFYMPHCLKQLTNNLLWANWGLNLGHCVVVSNSFHKIIESNSTRHVVECANYITKILPYVFEVAIINTFKYYEVFSDMAVHVFPKMNLVCPDAWENHQEPSYKQNDVEFVSKTVNSL
ncbi:SRR1-like protein [Diabrotica virgifera virgifera]|uniref:SRR1-like domain-containing protein n=2 Tax=Diabrotica virgifera virgifera TaxID=50390 RepID=A0ABM5KAC2_DIAVI|nr:SRR1-like protein [Diabrotica virgifera virgifera]